MLSTWKRLLNKEKLKSLLNRCREVQLLSRETQLLIMTFSWTIGVLAGSFGAFYIGSMLVSHIRWIVLRSISHRTLEGDLKDVGFIAFLILWLVAWVCIAWICLRLLTHVSWPTFVNRLRNTQRTIHPQDHGPKK